jgi:ABC-type Na+ efflux pump permease subunit
MSTTRAKLKNHLRIILAITAKDITDAIKNRMTLALVLGVGLVMLSGQAMPLLLKLSKPTVIIFDADKSGLLSELERDSELRLGVAASQQALEERIGEGSGPQIGLVIPAEFDQLVETGEPVELQGFFVHWIKAAEAEEIRAFFEKKLTALAGQPVRILTEGNTVYPAPDASGRPFMAAVTLVLVITTISGSLVPQLMIEEKETHTLDSLLVSPASIGQVMIGKALAGTAYGLTAAAVAFAFSWRMVVHWELAALAAVCTAVFAVSVGLVMGSLFDNPQSLSLWFGGVLIILLIPPFLVEVLGPNAPQVVRTVLPYIPTVVLLDMVRGSFSHSIPWAELVGGLGIVLACALILLGFAMWRLRGLER